MPLAAALVHSPRKTRVLKPPQPAICVLSLAVASYSLAAESKMIDFNF